MAQGPHPNTNALPLLAGVKEILGRTVVTINYLAHRVTFTKPAVFRPPSHAMARPFRFADRSEILVAAALDGSTLEGIPKSASPVQLEPREPGKPPVRLRIRRDEGTLEIVIPNAP